MTEYRSVGYYLGALLLDPPSGEWVLEFGVKQGDCTSNLIQGACNPTYKYP